MTDCIGTIYNEKKLSCRDQLDRVRFMMKTKQNNDVTDCTSVVYAKSDIELLWEIEPNADNDMTNCTDVVYIEHKTNLSWPIDLSAICNKNKIRQWCDRSYKSGLHRKWYWTIKTYRIKCGLWWKLDKIMMWLTFRMWSTPKMKLSCHDRLD